MRAIDPEYIKDSDDLPQRQSYRVKSYPEHPDGCQGALCSPKPLALVCLSSPDQVCECHDHHLLRPAHFSNTLKLGSAIVDFILYYEYFFHMGISRRALTILGLYWDYHDKRRVLVFTNSKNNT